MIACERCDFADVEERGLNRTWYHLKYHHPISNLWWEPRFWILTTRDFLFWWACRDYFGNFEWRGLKGLWNDWKFARDFRQDFLL